MTKQVELHEPDRETVESLVRAAAAGIPPELHETVVTAAFALFRANHPSLDLLTVDQEWLNKDMNDMIASAVECMRSALHKEQDIERARGIFAGEICVICAS